MNVKLQEGLVFGELIMKSHVDASTGEIIQSDRAGEAGVKTIYKPQLVPISKTATQSR